MGDHGFVFPIPTMITPEFCASMSDSAKGLIPRVNALWTRYVESDRCAAACERELDDLASLLQCVGTGLTADKRKHLDEEELAFDQFFRMRRSPSPDAFAVGIARGVVAIFHELSYPNSLLPEEAIALGSAFSRIAGHVGQGSINSVIARTTEWSPRGACPRSDGSACIESRVLDRWHNGHHAFVALIDGLILFYVQALRASKKNDAFAVESALRDINCLFYGSAAAMRLAGDMTRTEYGRLRSLMSPPHVAFGFSGLWNADHRLLLCLIRQLGTEFQQNQQQLNTERDDYFASIKAAYTTHAVVCEAVAGSSASLATPASDKAGHATLAAFASRTLKWAGLSTRRR